VSDQSGLLVVDKPAGLTSHDVVARVRRLAGTRKVGHAGTLDPMATGVLLVGLNRATRLLGHLALTEKAYDATVRLGLATTTDDAEGEPLAAADHDRLAALDEDAVRRAAARFVGDLQQRPSSVSAIKVDGRRAYARVRAGEDVELPARPVTVHELTVHAVRRVGPLLDLDLSLRCSTGTYVRAVARDLGHDLGVGGHLSALRRTSVGPFALADAATLEQLAERLAPLPMTEVVTRCFPTQVLDEPQARDVAVGRTLALDLSGDGPVGLLAPDGSFLALYARRGDLAAPVAVFV
jgi:tRNA pseudouridine55 synthase